MGKQWKQWLTLFFWAPKSLQMGHEIKRCLLLGRKVMTNLDSIFKSRDITLPTKVHLVKAMVFPVVMYGCESWTIKKAECRKIDAFERWCCKRLLKVPWNARRPNQSILKKISPRCSLEGLMLKLKLQYFGHLIQRADSFEKIWCWERMRAEGEGADRGWDGWIESLTQWTWVSKLQETVKDREVRCDAVYRVAKSQTWLNDSATITSTQVMLLHKYILELLSEWQGTIPEMLNMVELEDSLNPD